MTQNPYTQRAKTGNDPVKYEDFLAHKNQPHLTEDQIREILEASKSKIFFNNIVSVSSAPKIIFNNGLHNITDDTLLKAAMYDFVEIEFPNMYGFNDLEAFQEFDFYNDKALNDTVENAFKSDLYYYVFMSISKVAGVDGLGPVLKYPTASDENVNWYLITAVKDYKIRSTENPLNQEEVFKTHYKVRIGKLPLFYKIGFWVGVGNINTQDLTLSLPQSLNTYEVPFPMIVETVPEEPES